MITVCVWDRHITGHSSLEIAPEVQISASDRELLNRYSSSILTVFLTIMDVTRRDAISYLCNKYNAELKQTVDGSKKLIEKGKYRYISWNPQDEKVFDGIKSRAEMGTYQSDFDYFNKKTGNGKPHCVELSNLNEDVMIELWDMLCSKHQQYNFFNNNCSTVVFCLLMAGWSDGFDLNDVDGSVRLAERKLDNLINRHDLDSALRESGIAEPEIWLKELREIVSTAAFLSFWTVFPQAQILKIAGLAGLRAVKLFTWFINSGRTTQGANWLGKRLDRVVRDPTDIVRVAYVLKRLAG